MSATFRLEKKKASQQNLRRLMQEQRQSRSDETTKKIESAFAKYENGILVCTLCNSVVKSEKVWQVHINAKQHKEKLAEAKELKAKITSQGKKEDPVERLQKLQGLKRSIEEMRSELPDKKLKGILKNSSTVPSISNPPVEAAVTSENEQQAKATSSIPDDFFDTKPNAAQTEEEAVVVAAAEKESDDTLPEGFFDDPVKDAKIRNQEYKDPVEEEWEKFKKEIKEAEAESKVIINEDHEEATVVRQLDEIDEQIRNWSR